MNCVRVEAKLDREEIDREREGRYKKGKYFSYLTAKKGKLIDFPMKVYLKNLCK